MPIQNHVETPFTRMDIVVVVKETKENVDELEKQLKRWKAEICCVVSISMTVHSSRVKLPTSFKYPDFEVRWERLHISQLRLYNVAIAQYDCKLLVQAFPEALLAPYYLGSLRLICSKSIVGGLGPLFHQKYKFNTEYAWQRRILPDEQKAQLNFLRIRSKMVSDGITSPTAINDK